MSAYKLGGQFTFSTQLLTLYYLLYSPTDAAPQFFPETYPICSFGKISSQPHTIVKHLFSQWQCIVFVVVFSIQELNA